MLLISLIIIQLFAGTLNVMETLISCNDLPCNCVDGCGGIKSVNFGCLGNCKKLPQGTSWISEDNGWLGIGCQKGNLAYLKQTNQSSTFAQDTCSSNAVDGEFADTYVSHYFQTTLEDGPWWMVDLENLSAIDYVDIYLRKINNPDAHIKLRNPFVRVGNTSKIDNHTCCSHFCFLTANSSSNVFVDCKHDTVGRFVSIQLPSLSSNEMQTLTLAEVVVMGRPLCSVEPLISCNDLPCNCEGGCDGNQSVNYGCQGNCRKLPRSSRFSTDNGWMGAGCRIGNLAYLKTTSQSSNLDENPKHQAANAVDGYFADTREYHYSHTDFENAPWWMVDLGLVSAISYVDIYNRWKDTYKAYIRLSNFNVRVGNTSSIHDHRLCLFFEGTVPPRNFSRIVCEKDMFARFVSIQLTSQSRRINLQDQWTLTLPEVVVMGRTVCNFDECLSHSCINGGTCVDGFFNYTCTCPAGFTGVYCEINVDDCLTNSCINGGTCVDGISNYTCTCPAGFTGIYCEINVDECLSNSCINGGTCVDGISNYTCTCPAGFTGIYCEMNVDDCLTNSCINGGTCVDGISNYTCTCLVGFTGVYCEMNVDDCLTNSCINGGTCIDGISNYTCTCPAGFTGVHCEMSVHGTLCQTELDCTSILQNTTCINGNCSCKPGYFRGGKLDYCFELELGDPCDLDTDCKTTINNSVCIQGLCQCMQMYITDTSASPADCRLIGFGDECQDDIQCSLALENSVCIHRHCVCITGHQFDVIKNHCVDIYWWVWLCLGMGVVGILMVCCASVIIILAKRKRDNSEHQPLLFST